MTAEAATRWRHTWELLAAPAPAGILELLSERYGESHRAYHTLAHVLDCLAKAERCRELQRDAAAVDLALWFHDAIYDPRRSDNEERSAELAAEALASRLPSETMDRVAELILATRHHAPPDSADAAVVVDIDLSILGEDPERYDRYEEGIRAEYSWVPLEVYRRERSRILRGFLDREHLFTTPSFRERYAEQARRNLSRAIAAL